MFSQSLLMTCCRRSLLAALSILFLLLVAAAPAHAQSPGELDQTFGSNGSVTGASGAGLRMVVQPDGKILGSGGAAGTFVVNRFLPDGSLDSSFGSGGYATKSFCNPCGSASGATGMELQPDGKVVVAGASNTGGIGLARFLPDGSVDTTFGYQGVTGPGFTSVTSYPVCSSSHGVSDLALQPDGKIVVVGRCGNQWIVARFLADGSPDASFGAAYFNPFTGVPGVVVEDFGFGFAYSESAGSVAVQDDGKIVVGGTADNHFALVRYLPDGTRDSSFGTNGRVTTAVDPNFSSQINSIALQSDGSIVAAGEADTYMAVARYLSDGSLDSSFGSGGTIYTSDSSILELRDVLVLDDGSLLLAGRNYVSSFDQRFALVRLLPDGSFDSSFDGDGVVTTSFGTSYAGARTLAVQSDGKLLAGGVSGFSASNTELTIARYFGAPPAPNNPPTATIDVTDGATTNCWLLDGSRSLDPDGDTLSMSWTIGSEIVSTETSWQHCSDQTRTITLTVTDPDGAPDSDEVTLTPTVTPPPPPPTPQPPVITEIDPPEGGPGDTVVVIGHDFCDDETDQPDNIVTFDGKGATVLNESTTAINVITPVAFSPGQKVQVKVICDGAPSNPEPWEVVSMAPVANAIADVSEHDSMQVHYDGTTSYDPDGGKIISYIWRYDGKVVARTARFSRTYKTEGRKVVRLTVIDDEGERGSTRVAVSPDKPSKSVIIVPGVYFDFDKSDLRKNAKRQLRALRPYVAQSSKLKIRGYASDEKAMNFPNVSKSIEKATEAHNQRLSDQRANAVMRFLVKKLTKSEKPARIKAKGYGEDYTYKKLSKNRRVEIVLYGPAFGANHSG